MTLEKSWHAVLSDEIASPYIKDLKTFIAQQRGSNVPVYPPEEEVFNAFRLTPFEKVKVVIMGQDPYHGPGQAEGLCFSVKPGVQIPPSLRNIYKELNADLGLSIPQHGSLVKWAEQGVLLLNATLTVTQGAPKSHFGRGWEQFTDAVIKKLFDRKDPVVFVLWGNSAKQKCQNILLSRPSAHKILTSAHPSPLSATRFFGCRHFSKINETLVEWGKEPIDWNL